MKQQSIFAEIKTSKTLRNKHKLNKRDIEFFLMIAPAVLLLLLFNYIPMTGLVLAFKNYRVADGIFGSKFVGLKNFMFFFQSNDAWRITRNTVGLNLMFIFINVTFAVLFALMLYDIKSRLVTKVYQTSMILPHFFSWIIVSYMLYALLNPRLGIINNTFAQFKDYNWYGKPTLWPIILAVVYVWKTAGIDLVIYYAGLMGVNHEFFEAAELDGANKFQKIWYISLPSILPLIMIMTILKFGGIFRADFGMFYSLPMNSTLLYPVTDVIDTYIFRALKNVGDIGMSTAIGLFQSLVGLVMIITVNKIAGKIEPDNTLF